MHGFIFLLSKKAAFNQRGNLGLILFFDHISFKKEILFS